MKKLSFSGTEFELAAKRTREFLDEMNVVIPWSELLALIKKHAPSGKTGCQPFATEVLQPIHSLQQPFGHSGHAMEEALHDMPLYREFAHLDVGITRLPEERKILPFRYFLEEQGQGQRILATVNVKLTALRLPLKTGAVIDTTLIAVPSSTKSNTDERDSEMYQTKNDKHCHAAIRAQAEHPFGVIKCQFGHSKTPTQPRCGEKCAPKGLSNHQFIPNLASYNLVRMRSLGRVRTET
ncbi:hypothetical protein B9Z45_15515 [Limnohabitans sp. 2KL-17]|nr:hypothetical protein B9Z45_15515 [Limnohabitans sp. 2KL-17]